MKQFNFNNYLKNNLLLEQTNIDKQTQSKKLTAKDIIEYYLDASAPEDWNTNPEYKVSLSDVEHMLNMALKKRLEL